MILTSEPSPLIPAGFSAMEAPLQQFNAFVIINRLSLFMASFLNESEKDRMIARADEYRDLYRRLTHDTSRGKEKV